MHWKGHEKNNTIIFILIKDHYIDIDNFDRIIIIIIMIIIIII